MDFELLRAYLNSIANSRPARCSLEVSNSETVSNDWQQSAGRLASPRARAMKDEYLKVSKAFKIVSSKIGY